MPDKVTTSMGPPIRTFQGLRIHAYLEQPKTKRGRARVWVSIRQPKGPKRWRISECLAYVNAVDIQFEERRDK